MARFLRRSRIQQAALERAEHREQQLLDEIQELRAACSATRADVSNIKEQMSPALRTNKLQTTSCPGSPDATSGDCSPAPQVINISYFIYKVIQF